MFHYLFSFVFFGALPSFVCQIGWVWLPSIVVLVTSFASQPQSILWSSVCSITSYSSSSVHSQWLCVEMDGLPWNQLWSSVCSIILLSFLLWCISNFCASNVWVCLQSKFCVSNMWFVLIVVPVTSFTSQPWSKFCSITSCSSSSVHFQILCVKWVDCLYLDCGRS